MLETNLFFRDIAKNNPQAYQMTPEDIRRMQMVLLKILEDIDRVCRKYGLTYFLCGGTAIGAVRHQGFIPWDDDIDLTMPRRDYDLLEKCLLAEFSDRYWVQNIGTDKNYDLNFMKVRRKGTECLEFLDPESDKAGIFVDIFPLEDTCDNRLVSRLHGLFGEGMLFICSCVRLRGKKDRVLPFLKDEKAIKTVRTKVRIGGLFSFMKLSTWLRLTKKVLSCCHNKNSRYVSIPSGRMHYFREMYTRTSFFPPKTIKFQGRDFMIMNDPDEYLSKMYGDYRKLPPEDQRESHTLLRFDAGEGNSDG